MHISLSCLATFVHSDVLNIEVNSALTKQSLTLPF